MRKYILFGVLLCGCVLTVTLSLNRDILACYFYIYKLNRTTEGGQILEYNYKISHLGSTVIPILERNFSDNDLSSKIRQATTVAMVNINPVAARLLFEKYLDIGNIDQVTESIYGLYLLKIKDIEDKVIKLSTSPESRIRKNVALYLGMTNSSSSLTVLKKLAKDEDPYVRYCANLTLK